MRLWAAHHGDSDDDDDILTPFCKLSGGSSDTLQSRADTLPLSSPTPEACLCYGTPPAVALQRFSTPPL